MDFHHQSIAQAKKALNVGKQGLSQKEAKKRQEKYGSNTLPQASASAGRAKIFIDQWKSPLLLLLVVAGTISGLLGEMLDMTIIYITAIINAGVGFIQEDKANRALKKLHTLIKYPAFVIRDGQKKQIASEDLVKGDIMLLQAGDKVQADGRIIEAVDCTINEATLTGESEPVRKHHKKTATKTPTFDRKNMVYRGTVVLNGRATVLVTATGVDTEIGHVATLVKETTDEQTPLQQQLGRLGKILSIVVLLISIGIFVVGLLRPGEYELFHIFETAVAVAVAAIPEGLVVALTVILAIGMQFILKRGALVRKLVAAETLGSVSVICTDKTGTLTEGNMHVTTLVTANETCNAAELQRVDILASKTHEDVLMALRVGVFCNDAILQNPEEEQAKWKFVGDTTDIPLVRLGMQVGLEKHHLDNAIPRVAEIPFDSSKKYMATLQYEGDDGTIFIKGASDVLLKKCTFYQDNAKIKKLAKAKLQYFQKQEERLTKKGFRVLALAYKKVDVKKKKITTADVDELVFAGLVALSDPLRPDVKETLAIAKKAGMHIVMITGDHVKTAKAIAEEIGLRVTDKHVFDGEKLNTIDDKELQEVVKQAVVFARVDPKHKIRIVQAFQANGEVVAMTGDGVNDAPALKGADIGIALGSGTDVAKETSDMVLTNNSLSTIVAAVEEGRGIYQNIKKIVLYLLSGSFAEVVLVIGSMFAGLPIPALPAQILWVNIIENTLPTMALAFDKPDKENMSDPPRKKNATLLDAEVKTMIVMKSILANVILFAIFYWFWKTTQDIKLTRTIVFVGFAIDALFYIFSIRSLRRMVWQMNPFNNKYLIMAVGAGWLLLLIAIYWPPLQILLRTVPLEPWHWALMIGFGIFNMVLIETIKWFFLIKRKKT